MRISEQNTTKIQLNETKVDIPSNTLGIDIGQSLTKISYLEENDLILKMFPTSSDFSDVNEFIESKKKTLKKINFTGGKAFFLYNKHSAELKTNLINEFEANIGGIDFLYENKKSRAIPPSIVVTLGTGTSILLKTEDIQHLGGSAAGGGFFMGLVALLFPELKGNFSEAISCASKGNRYNVDLKVSDIYDIEDTRVNKLFREFTAAALGKINENSNIDSATKEDVIASLIGIIGENLGTIATLMAENHKLNLIIYCGGFLIGNKPLKQILSLLSKIKGIKPIFLDNSVFAGAIGALKFRANS
ncbi:MAG: hypothetical protein ACXABG_03880 [Promethearchaeota archaeon]|jgi:type II pantothenate kinase